MFANKQLEKKILTSKKKDEEKKTKKKTPTLPMAFTPIGSNYKLTPQLPTAKKTNIVDQAAKQSNAEIARQQQNYANARAQGDYAGMRTANTLANKARASQGAPAYSSAKGDTQFKGNLPRALPKANTARINNYINTGISAPQLSNTPAYIKSYNKGNYLKGTGQLALSTLGAGADLLRNVSANAVSLTSGKGLQPYRADYTKQQYEQNINKFTGNTPLYEQLNKLSPKLSNAYLNTGEILEDPLNLFDVGAKLTATGLKNAGSAIYAQDLLKGGKKFVPAVTKTTMPTLTPNGKIKNVKATLPVNNTSGFLGQIGDRFEVSKPIITASGKKIASTEDFKKLPTAEKIEVLQSAEKAQPSLPMRASNQAVQPQNVNAVANLPQAEKATPNLPYNPNKIQGNLPKASETIKPQLKPLGADLNQFPRQMKVSKVKTNTLRNSKIFSDAEKNIDDAAFEYDVISEKQSLQEAKQRLQADFNGEVKDLSTKKDFDGVDLDTSMGIAEQYLREAEQTGDYKNFLNWTKNIQEKGTQSGQMIQAFAKYTRTPEGAVIKGQQTVNRIIKELSKDNPKLLDSINEETKDILRKALNGEYEKIKGSKKFVEDIRSLAASGNINKDSVEELVKGKYDIPTLTSEDVKNITENMKLGQESTNAYIKEMYFNKAEQIISNKVPASKLEKFTALQRLQMILNPVTLISRNPLGNVILGSVENIKDIPAATADKLISLKTGQRTTTLNPQLGAQLKGAKQGLAEWAKDIKYGVDTSPSRGQYELPNKRIFKNNFLNSLDMVERRLLQLGDRPFYQAAYNGRIAELKKLSITGEEAETQARLYALDRVFQNNSNLAKGAKKLRDSLNEMAGGLPVGNLVMPFSQTPANIMDKLLDYSPAGMAKAISQLGTIRKGTFDQKLFVDRIGRTFTGAGIAMLAYAMAKNNLLTGNMPQNNDVRNALYLAGQKPYAFKIGNSYYTYDWAQPIGGIIAAVADAYKAGATKEDLIDSIGAGSKSLVDSVFNQSFLSGVLSMLSGYSPAAGISKALLGSTSQLTPSAGANIAKIIDPNMRETYDPNTLKEQSNKLVARIPFASKTLPKKLDTTGKPMLQSQGRSAFSRAVENLIAPYKKSEEVKDVVNDELLRLYDSTGETNQLLNSADKKFTANGKPYLLTAKDYTQYQTTLGKYAYENMQNLISSDSYMNMSDTDKVKALRKINDAAKETARAEYFSKNGMSPLLAYDKTKLEKYNKYVKSSGLSDKQYIKALDTIKLANGDSKGGANVLEAIKALGTTNLSSKQKQAVIQSLFATENNLLKQNQ